MAQRMPRSARIAGRSAAPCQGCDPCCSLRPCVPTRTYGGSTMRSDIVPGATFPDYELPDHTDVPRRLSELQGDDPMILTLARGHYCPKEHQQHLELASFYPRIAVAYT